MHLVNPYAPIGPRENSRLPFFRACRYSSGFSSLYACPSSSPHALDDPARLAALYRTGLLDSCEEETFDRFTRLAARIIGAPVSLFSLLDHNRSFFKSTHGFPNDLSHVREVGPRCIALSVRCGDERPPKCAGRSRARRSATQPGSLSIWACVAYLGVPVRASDGVVIGSLCAIDTRAARVVRRRPRRAGGTERSHHDRTQSARQRAPLPRVGRDDVAGHVRSRCRRRCDRVAPCPSA